MSKKRMLLPLLLIIIFILLAVSYVANNQNTAENTAEDQPQNNPPEGLDQPDFAVPETPIGVLGLISALAAGFGTYLAIKRKRITPY